MSLKPSKAARTQGYALIEVITAAVLIGLVAVSSVQAFGVLNRMAAGSRIFTNARVIVQRNVDKALSVTCSKSAIPAILAITPAAGTVYDDDGGATNIVTVVLEGTSNVQLVQGTLTRIVTAVTNPDSADIRQITFRIDYTYRSRPYAYSLSTMRALDD